MGLTTVDTTVVFIICPRSRQRFTLGVFFRKRKQVVHVLCGWDRSWCFWAMSSCLFSLIFLEDAACNVWNRSASAPKSCLVTWVLGSRYLIQQRIGLAIKNEHEATPVLLLSQAEDIVAIAESLSSKVSLLDLFKTVHWKEMACHSNVSVRIWGRMNVQIWYVSIYIYIYMFPSSINHKALTLVPIFQGAFQNFPIQIILEAVFALGASGLTV